MFAHKFKYILSILVVLLTLSSCYDYASRERLARAQALLEHEHPDSAADVLDSIYSPQDMGKKYYMQYLITKVQANYKAYRDIQRDTVILQAVKYYEKKNSNLEQTTLANYLAGCVLMERGENKKAIPYFKTALNKTSLTHNYALQGLICGNLAYLYHKELLQEKAIDYYKMALSSTRRNKGSEINQMNILSFLAANFITNEQPDSALHYLEQSVTIADSIQDQYYQVSGRNNIGLAYQQKKDYKRSNLILKEALYYNMDSSLRNKIQLNIADNNLKLNNFNAIKKYLPIFIKSLKTSSDLYYKSAVNDFLRQYETKTQNYEQALFYSEENYHIASKIFDQNQSKSLIDAEKEFDYSQKVSEAKLARQRQQNTTLLFSMLLLLITGIGLLLRFKAKQRQKLKNIVEENERITLKTKNKEMERRLNQYIDSNNQYKTLIRNTADLHLVIHHTAQAGETTDKSNRFSKIKKALSQTEDTIRNNMGDLSRSFLLEQNFSSKLINNDISNTDAIILFMLYNKENRKDIAALLATNPHALTQRISRLKEKMKPLLTESEYQLFFQ